MVGACRACRPEGGRASGGWLMFGIESGVTSHRGLVLHPGAPRFTVANANLRLRRQQCTVLQAASEKGPSKGSSHVNVNSARAVSHFHVSRSMCLSRASGFPSASVCLLGPSPLTSLARPATLTRPPTPPRLTYPKSHGSSPAQSRLPGSQGLREREKASTWSV